MGNRCGCCAGRNCPSLLRRDKGKPDTRISKPSLQAPEINKVPEAFLEPPGERKRPLQALEAGNGPISGFPELPGLDVAPVYDDVSEFPVYATVSKPKNMKLDDSSVHYADIQVFAKPRERSAQEVKTLQSQNATEYATLNFPRAPLKYDNKNGTLV